MPGAEDPSASPLILLTGATGYVGGRLWARLERDSRRLRLMTRRPGQLAAQVAPSTDVVRGDVKEPASLRPALAGVDTAYYLVHSMASGTDYREADRRGRGGVRRGGARRRGAADRLPRRAGPRRGPVGHLASRQEVGRVLARVGGARRSSCAPRSSSAPGSLSFEMVRALVDRLPVMVTPRWVRHA